jgi:AcrR family transcriptional regulator
MFPHLVKQNQARREEFLDTAQSLFASQGYDGTSVNQIIAELGVSKGAFYHYFKSKEDLVEALACRFAQTVAAQADDILGDEVQDAFSKLTAFMSIMRRHKVDNVAELRATFEPLMRAENVHLFERTHRAVSEVVLPTLVRIIADGVDERTFDTTNPQGAAETILHLMTAQRPLLSQIYYTRDAQEFRRLADQLHARMQYTSTVIDRILGLPEGSIDLADRDTFEAMACVLDPTPDAA